MSLRKIVCLWIVVCAALSTSSQAALGGPIGLAKVRVPDVSVFAGSGVAGVSDGPRDSATFILPTALALDRMGNLYVADASAQRIRMVRADGSVVTLGGSGEVTRSGLRVIGGFQDGPAAQSRFNRPSGIAVDKLGRIFVSDTYNHCIRLIVDRMVSTYAGTCGKVGKVDGDRETATLSFPRELALAPDGTLFVADAMDGVRKIDTAGGITTLPIPVDERVTGIALEDSGRLVVSDIGGLHFFDRNGGQTRRVPSSYPTQKFPPPVAGGLSLGIPFAVAARGNGDEVFFTDLRDDSVKAWSDGSFLSYVSPVPREDAVVGIQDDPNSALRLHGPMGIVYDRANWLYVADSGHKRILRYRVGPNISNRGFLDPQSLLTIKPNPAEYRIVVIGNSFVYFSASERRSLGAFVEEKLARDNVLAAYHRKPRVLSVVATGALLGLPSLTKEVISNSSVDFVVVLVNGFDLAQFAPDPKWGKLLGNVEAEIIGGLKGSKIKSMFVSIPGHTEVTPLEQLYQFENLNDEAFNNDGSVEAEIMGGLAPIGIPILDLYGAVETYEARPFVQPLYSNEDLHPTEFGRRFFAARIASKLEALRPWASVDSK